MKYSLNTETLYKSWTEVTLDLHDRHESQKSWRRWKMARSGKEFRGRTRTDEICNQVLYRMSPARLFSRKHAIGLRKAVQSVSRLRSLRDPMLSSTVPPEAKCILGQNNGTSTVIVDHRDGRAYTD